LLEIVKGKRIMSLELGEGCGKLFRIVVGDAVACGTGLLGVVNGDGAG
jgi:hypothetical protein